MRISALALVAIISVSLLGCAASGPIYGDPTPLGPGSSEIVVYRPDRFARGGVTYSVHLDGKEVARLQNAGFASISTSPGSHELEIQASAMQRFKPMKLAAELKPGARLYFRFEPSMSGVPVIGPYAIVLPIAYELVPVPEAQALTELRELKRSE